MWFCAQLNTFFSLSSPFNIMIAVRSVVRPWATADVPMPDDDFTFSSVTSAAIWSYRYVCIVYCSTRANAHNVQFHFQLYLHPPHFGILNAENHNGLTSHTAQMPCHSEICFIIIFFFFRSSHILDIEMIRCDIYRDGYSSFLAPFFLLLLLSISFCSIHFCSFFLFYFQIRFLIVYFVLLKCTNSPCFGSLTIGCDFLGDALSFVFVHAMNRTASPIASYARLVINEPTTMIPNLRAHTHTHTPGTDWLTRAHGAQNCLWGFATIIVIDIRIMIYLQHKVHYNIRPGRKLHINKIRHLDPLQRTRNSMGAHGACWNRNRIESNRIEWTVHTVHTAQITSNVYNHKIRPFENCIILSTHSLTHSRSVALCAALHSAALPCCTNMCVHKWKIYRE